MVTEPESVIRIETEPSLRPDALAHAPLRHIEPGPLPAWGYDRRLWEVPERITLLVLASQLFADQQDRLRFFQTVLAQGRAVARQVWFKRADGSLVPVSAEGVLAPEAAGFFLRLEFRQLEEEPMARPSAGTPGASSGAPGPPPSSTGASSAPGRAGEDPGHGGEATHGPGGPSVEPARSTAPPGRSTPGTGIGPSAAGRPPATGPTRREGPAGREGSPGASDREGPAGTSGHGGSPGPTDREGPPGPAGPAGPPGEPPGGGPPRPPTAVSMELRGHVLDRLAIPDVGRTADRVVRFLDWIVPRHAPLLISAPEGGGATILIEAIHRARHPGGRVVVIDAELGVLSSVHASLAALASATRDTTEGLLVRRADVAPAAIQQQLIEVAQRRTRAPGGAPALYATARPGAPIIRRFSDEAGGDVFTLPSLSERPQDIVPAMSRMLRRPRPGLRIFQTIQPEAARLLQTYEWPGNVDEMREIAEAARLISGGAEFRVEDLPPAIRGGIAAPSGRRIPEGARGRRGRPEKRLTPDEIRRALDAAGGSRTEAAKMLGVSRTTLWRKMAELGEDLLSSEKPGDGGEGSGPERE